MNGIKTCAQLAGLASITKSDTELVIWQRSLSSKLQNWIGQMDAANLPDERLLVKPREVWRALELILNRGDFIKNDMWDLLLADINNLVIGFADITQSQEVDVRLQRISGDACWKFHRDTVKTRLLTTYRGPATEWVKQAYSEQAISEQREYKGPLEQLGAGDVAIFKGSISSPNRGIVHRSPPIDGSGLTRLLLCLNQRSEASPAPWIEP